MAKFLAKPIIAKNGGDEGGEILFEKGDTNTSIAGTGVTIDVYQNKLRFFEQGGDTRGAYIDLTAASNSVGSNLLAGGGGGGTTLPAGSIQMYAGASAPSGWLLCDGTAVSRTTYSSLWDTLRNGTSSSPYGNGDGSTTFNVPDMRSRMPIGAGTGTGLSARALGATGGVESVTLTAAQSGLVGHGHANTFSASSGNQSADHSHDVSHGHTASSGTVSSDHAHNIPRGLIAAAGTNRAVVSTNNNQATIYTGGINANHVHGITVDINYFSSGGMSASHNHAITMSGSVTNVSSANASESHDNMSPFLAVNFIIKS